ncbi:MAG: hypothetical protein ABJQ34_15645 [Paracoccaceae bacterium]
MKHSLKLAALVAALTFSPLSTTFVHAQEAIGVKLGTTIVGAVLKAIVSKGLDSIFGGSEGLTPEDLSEAISAGFNDAAKAAIDVDVDTLASEMRVYLPSAPYSSVDTSLRNWREMTGNIQAQVKTHMSKGNFLDLMPTYIAATNSRLALMSEIRRHEYEKQPTDDYLTQMNLTIASEVVRAMDETKTFFLHDFFDPEIDMLQIFKAGGCLNKDESDNYYLVGSSYTFKVPNKVFPVSTKVKVTDADANLSTHWCPREAGYTWYEKPFNPNFNPATGKAVTSSGVSTYAHMFDGSPTRYGVTYRYPGETNEGHSYRYSSHTTAEAAAFAQARGAMDMYPNRLGDMTQQINAWFDLVSEIGTEAQILEAAKHATVFMDHEELMHRTPDAYATWYKNTALPLIRGISS